MPTAGRSTNAAIEIPEEDVEFLARLDQILTRRNSWLGHRGRHSPPTSGIGAGYGSTGGESSVVELGKCRPAGS